MTNHLERVEQKYNAMCDILWKVVKPDFKSDCATLAAQKIAELTKKNIDLMREKEDLKGRNQLLRTRADLPIERAREYDDLVARVNELETQLFGKPQTFKSREHLVASIVLSMPDEYPQGFAEYLADEMLRKKEAVCEQSPQ